MLKLLAKQCYNLYSFCVIILDLGSQEQMSSHPIQVRTIVCTLRVGRKVAETRPMAQHSIPGKVMGSGLLDVHRQESIADSRHHTQRYFQAMQCAAWHI